MYTVFQCCTHRRHDIQHDDINHNDTQRINKMHNNGTPSECVCWVSFMLSLANRTIMMSVVMVNVVLLSVVVTSIKSHETIFGGIYAQIGIFWPRLYLKQCLHRRQNNKYLSLAIAIWDRLFYFKIASLSKIPNSTSPVYTNHKFVISCAKNN